MALPQLFNNNFIFKDGYTIQDIALIPEFPQIVIPFIHELIHDGYQIKFAFYLSIYYVLYHFPRFIVDGSIHAYDVNFFKGTYSNPVSHRYHPYFNFLYTEEPSLRDYFLSQATIND